MTIDEQKKEIENHIASLRDQSERNERDIRAVFREVRSLVDDREQALLLEIRTALSKEEETLQNAFRRNDSASRKV